MRVEQHLRSSSLHRALMDDLANAPDPDAALQAVLLGVVIKKGSELVREEPNVRS
jgi:hypothetical protein